MEIARQRTPPEASPPDQGLPGRGDLPARAWELRVLNGVHAGGVRRCGDRDVILVGSSDDCDLILADTAVAARHALISIVADEVFVRAVEAGITLAGRNLHPGAKPLRVEPMQEIRVGAVRLCIGREGDDRWAAHQPALPTPECDDAKPSRSPRLLPAAVALAALAGLLIVLAMPPTDTQDGGRQLDQLRTLVESLGLEEVGVAVGEDGRPRITGYVADADQAGALRQRLEQLPFPVENQARSGARIAGDVQEYLRLSGLSAQARYIGAGRVEVRGAFPDEAKLARVLGAPQISDIAGLAEVVPVNTAPPPTQPLPAEVDRRFVIVRVDYGEDPFIVTADGGHYYLGATLPTGEVLLAIVPETALLYSTSHGLRRLDLRRHPGGGG